MPGTKQLESKHQDGTRFEAQDGQHFHHLLAKQKTTIFYSFPQLSRISDSNRLKFAVTPVIMFDVLLGLSERLGGGIPWHRKIGKKSRF